MPKQHRLSNIDLTLKVADCAICGPSSLVRIHAGKPKCDTKVREKITAQTRQKADSLKPTKATLEFHRISEVDKSSGLGTCSVCGPNTPLRFHTKRTVCDAGLRERIKRNEENRNSRDRSFRYAHRAIIKDRLLEMTCERCGFVAEDLCQLDVDHIVRKADGGSDRPENLMVLCANCHRLKTKFERIGKSNSQTHPVSTP